MLRKLLLTLVTGLVFYTPTALALGLGEIKLNSNLNEPLDAEITLLSIRGETPEQIIASLGSNDDFQRSGIDRLYFLTRIRFETVSVNNNRMVVRLTTEDPVREPFLNFLVSLDWPNGKLLREYTLLLDPPIFDDAPVVQQVTPVQTPSRTTTPAPTPRPSQPARTIPRQQFDGEVYGPTNSNDTLWGIASKVRPDNSVSIHRAMVALYEENPDAFMQGNINRLKRGAELRVPDQAAFEQVSQREALQLIREHESAWKSGTAINRVMDTSDFNNEPMVSRDSSSDGSGRLSLATEEQIAEGSGGSNAAIAEEENLVLRQQKQELEEQNRSDAERIEQLERLLELKNEQLATLQADAQEQMNNEVQQVTEEPIATAPEPEAQTTEATQTAIEPAIPVTESAPQPQPAPGLMDQLLAGAYNLYLGILAVIILIIAFVVRARNKQDMSYQDAITQTSSGTTSVAPSGLDADVLPETADEVLADDSNLYDTAPMDDSEAADPIGEADIYMAYGKFDQAETLLLNAIAEDDERAELHAKLLECYAEMDSKAKFEDHLSNIEPILNTDAELAQMVQDVYTTAWPEGDYYADTEQLPDADEMVAEQDDSPEYEEATESETDFSAMADSISTDDDDVDELPSTEDVFGEVDSVDEEDELANEFADLDLDQELGLTDDNDMQEADEPSEVVDDGLSDELDIDADLDEGADDAEDSELGEDDVDTQLDLASAYIEMGDYEGAREIIEEVLESGSSDQQQKAQDLLDSIEN